MSHEPQDLAAKHIAWAGVVIAGVICLTLAICLLLWHHWRTDAGVATLPPTPRLQAHPAADLRDVRQAQVPATDGWGWADADHSVARIPVTRAMQIMAAESHR